MKTKSLNLAFLVMMAFLTSSSYAACEQEVDEWIVLHNKSPLNRDRNSQRGAESRQAHQDDIKNYQCPAPSGVAYAKHLLQLTIKGDQSGVNEAEKHWLARRESFYLDHWNLATATQKKNACIVRAKLEKCSLGSLESNQTTQNASALNNQATSSTPTPNAPLATPESQTSRAELERSTQLAAQRQRNFDQARQGKPKRHIVAREAHNCLKPQTGGGVINDCPYAVEYSYCVLRPEPNTWSESFTCGKSMGSWQIGPGPNARSIMHTAGQATYWFACRYGDTLSKPDGVSPVDLEFQAGRGLTGRCAEWGGGSSASASQAYTAPPAEPARPVAQQIAPPARPAFTPGVCTRADGQTNKRIQVSDGSVTDRRIGATA